MRSIQSLTEFSIAMPEESEGQALRGAAASGSLRGSFVETAFTTEQAANAVAEDQRRGLTDAPCEFLDTTTTADPQ